MRILTTGDNPLTSTGYGQTWDNLLKRWAKLKPDWEFYHMGWQNRDRPHKTADGYYMLGINKFEYGFDILTRYLVQYKPDVFLSMADIGVQSGYIEGVFEARKLGWRGKWIAYSCMDSHSWEYLLWNKILDVPDLVLSMANHGELIFKKFGVRKVSTIPLGVDTKVFYPMAERDIIRDRFGLSKCFVVGFVGKNQRRKGIPLLMKSFAQFAKDKDDVRLIMHTDKDASSGAIGWSLPCLMAKYEQISPNLTKKIVYTKQDLDVMARQMIQPSTMNEIYNLMDVFCYATCGEGFGLPGLECQAAGIPLMMTNYSTAWELTNEGQTGVLMPVMKDSYGRDVVEIGNNGIENVYVDDIECAKALEKMYAEWKEEGLKERSEKARQFSLKYDWDLIAPKFLKLFEDV